MQNVEERRRQWAEVQRQAPDIADFITDFNAVFGRAAFTQAEIMGSVVVDTFPRKTDWECKGGILASEILEERYGKL